MDITITINTDNDAFYHGHLYTELRRILGTCIEKIKVQRSRSLGCTCEAPEIADALLDINGNTVGTLTVKRS